MERKAKELLNNAASFYASDIHFVPMENYGIIRFRIDGKLYDMEKLSAATLMKLISHLKFVSNMDVGEKRRPQNGSLELTLLKKRYSLRLSTFPSTFHETLVIRLLPQEHRKTLQELLLFPIQANKLLRLMKYRNGLLIISGPTGSGKTTTIYSLLNSTQKYHKRNIITLEDPVEQKNDQFLQLEINERAGITYSVGLRSLLRHDPDLIMIGEIRDHETAKMAVGASLTGHFVISTLHSSSAIGALHRLYDLGISYQDMKETVKGIISQRLVNIICPYCGPNCKAYCLKERKNRRGAILEILTEEEIKNAVENPEKLTYPRLKHQLCKAIALGFVDEKEYDYFD